jgi:hypothetical protein
MYCHYDEICQNARDWKEIEYQKKNWHKTQMKREVLAAHFFILFFHLPKSLFIFLKRMDEGWGNTQIHKRHLVFDDDDDDDGDGKCKQIVRENDL